MISRKEAKEEFLTMNQPVTPQPEERTEDISEAMNDEDNSDVDVAESSKKINNTVKHEVPRVVSELYMFLLINSFAFFAWFDTE